MQRARACLLWAFPNELSISAVAADYLEGPGFKRIDCLGCVLVRGCIYPPPPSPSSLSIRRSCDVRREERGICNPRFPHMKSFTFFVGLCVLVANNLSTPSYIRRHTWNPDWRRSRSVSSVAPAACNSSSPLLSAASSLQVEKYLLGCANDYFFCSHLRKS